MFLCACVYFGLGKLDVIFDLASIVLHAESIYPPHFGSLHLRFDTHHFRNISWLGYCLHAKPKYYSISKTWTVCMRNNVCYHWLRFWIMTFITNCSPRKWQCDDAEPQTLDYTFWLKLICAAKMANGRECEMHSGFSLNDKYSYVFGCCNLFYSSSFMGL